MIKESELRFCILFLERNWAYKTNLFISIQKLEPKNAILSKGIFLANCVKRANFLIIWCPYSSRVGEPLSLCILKTTNFRLCVKQNVPTYDALSTKNFCSKSNTFWDISSQSFQIGSGTPCSCLMCFLYVKRSMQCPLLQIAIYINFSSRFILLLLIWLIIMTCYSVLQYAKKSSRLAFGILQRFCFRIMYSKTWQIQKRTKIS